MSAASLTRLAEDIDLGRFVLLGRGEEKTGGRQKHAILADSFEALIAAIYLDGGIEAARDVHRVAVRAADRRGGRSGGGGDVHRGLEVRAAGVAAGRTAAGCRTTASPPPRAPTTASASTSRCSSAARSSGRAEGRSKKEAEQQAARAALGAQEAQFR